jgi:hypothetical protein
MPPEDIVPLLHRYQWLTSLFSLVSVGFWIWMCLDAYKRRGGLDNWHYFFFFFPPSVLLYFFAHKGDMLFGSRRGSVGGLFGFGLRSRIDRAENQFRVSGTIAARFELAELYFESGRYVECEKHFEEVLKFDPNSLDALYYTGICRIKAGDNAKALELLQRVMDGNKKLRFGVAWLRYTECLIAGNKKEEALEERRKLSRAFPRPLTEFAYAQLLADSGQRDKAREVLDEMIATAADAPAEDRVWVSKGKGLIKTL